MLLKKTNKQTNKLEFLILERSLPFLNLLCNQRVSPIKEDESLKPGIGFINHKIVTSLRINSNTKNLVRGENRL